MDCFDEDDEFADDIDWSSIPMPTPTPRKRQRLANDSPPSSGLLSHLEMAQEYTPPEADHDDDQEIGDELQNRAISISVEQRKNLFLTGKAGTGKSWVTRRIVSQFTKLDRVIHVTAPTGIAAINVGGTTVNHFGRYELGQYYTDFNNMMSEETRKKIVKSDALLIDEISMLDGQTLDCLECMVAIARRYGEVKERVKEIQAETGDKKTIMSMHMLNQRWAALGDIEPWGGLQVIFVGDFFQLPPVPNGYDVLMENENLTESGVHLKIGRQGSYAFESRCWEMSNLNTIELTQVHRQAGNDGLFQCLNAMREGHDLTSHSSVLAALQKPLDSRKDGLLPTELYSKNYIVDRRNREELAKIQSFEVEMNSLDCVEFDQSYKQRVIGDPRLAALSTRELLNGVHEDLKWGTKNQLRRDFDILNEYAQEHFFAKSCRANQTISLKEGAQALLLWNLELDSKLANGSRGVVEGFVSNQVYTDLVKAELKTRDDANEAIEGSPKSASGESDSDAIKSIKSTLSSMSTKKLEKELKDLKLIADSAAQFRDFPFVRFANGPKRVIRPQAFEKEFKGCGTATRWQVPLTLAWAISIHKSQGMTIEWLKVDLRDCFAIGQAYVACSRGKGVQSMSVVNYDPREIKVSGKVKRFARCVQQGKPYDGPLWHDTLAEFDRLVRLEIDQQKKMKSHYTQTEKRRCDKCGAVCVLNQIKSNASGNQGKYFVSCPNGGRGEQGHTWELVNTLPLKSETVTPAKAAESFKHYIPGQSGAIPGRLKGLRFVCSGVFPELGGGFGLKLGRDNLKKMIEGFGGTVTSGISGKTDYLLVGDEAGVKRQEEATKKKVPILDKMTFARILIGKEDLPQTKCKKSQKTMKQFVKSVYDEV